MESPDLSDPDVRELLDRNHKPIEITVRRLGDTLAPLPVICEQCGEPYPCPTRVALREEEADSLARTKAKLHARIKAHWARYPSCMCGRKDPHAEHSHTGFTRTFYCPGVEEPVDTTSWVEEVTGTRAPCPVSSGHAAHPWSLAKERFWCPGG